MTDCVVGDLSFQIQRKVKNNQKIPESDVYNWLMQAALGLQYLHSKRIIHRDIKTQNLFLTGDNTIKIGDFGISKVLSETTKNQFAMTVVGTPYYMSPEACQSEPQTSKSDVWALGCVVHEICTLEHTFQADNLLNLVFKICSSEAKPIPECYSVELNAVV